MLFCLSFHDGSDFVFKMTHIKKKKKKKKKKKMTHIIIPWLPRLTHAMLPSYLVRNDLVSPRPHDTF